MWQALQASDPPFGAATVLVKNVEIVEQDVNCLMVGLKTQNDLEIALRQNMWLGEILERFEEIVLPDSWLVAGAIAQTIWNLRCEQPAEFGLKDVDLIYFDEEDLSFEAEASHERRLRDLFAHFR